MTTLQNYFGLLDFYKSALVEKLNIPFMGSRISAGFPSPADDFLESSIDLNKELVKRPQSTFYARVKGVSMIDAGIDDGDLLVIDKSLSAKNGSIAVCFVDGEFTVKTLKLDKNTCWLMPANSNYKPIKVTPDTNFQIWGIVVHVIKTVN